MNLLFALSVAFPIYDTPAFCAHASEGKESVLHFCLGVENSMRVTAEEAWHNASEERRRHCVEEVSEFARAKGFPDGGYSRLSPCLSRPDPTGKGDRLR